MRNYDFDKQYSYLNMKFKSLDLENIAGFEWDEGNINKIPEFKNEGEEFEFWINSDSFEYINWAKAKNIKFTNLKKTTKKLFLNTKSIKSERRLFT